MNSKERVDVSRELLDNSAQFPTSLSWIVYEKAVIDFNTGRIDSNEFRRQTNYYETVNTDWFDVLTLNSFSNKHTISVSGGSKAFNYYASVGYNNENGATRRENLNGLTSSVKLHGTVNRFKYQFGITTPSNMRSYTPLNSEGVNIIQYAYETSRAIPVYNQDGAPYFYEKMSGSECYPFNMENEINTIINKINNFSYNISGTVAYTILKGLDAEVVASYSNSNDKNETVFEEGSNYIAELRKGGPGDRNTVCPFGGEYRVSNNRSPLT